MKYAVPWLSMSLIVMVGALALGTSEIQADPSYEVNIINVTRGQLITPPLVIVHKSGFKLFTPGAPAIPELAALAEDGDTAPLEGFLSTLEEVHDVAVSSVPLLPGESVTVEVDVVGQFREITAVGMLATSNDAFFAVNGVRVPVKSRTIGGLAYDAGSEVNSESCEFIPGPPCENPFVRDTDGAEGFVHIHAGVHGTGDLIPSEHDWHNPAVVVTIDRMP
jgi:hypothetical protein